MRVRLTQRIVDRTEFRAAAEGPLLIWDTQLAGFGLRISAGRKTFVAQYRDADRHQRRLRVGDARHQTCDEARLLAQQLIAEKLRPTSRHRSTPISQRSVASVLAVFLQEYVSQRHKPTTQREERRLIDRLLLPALGHIELGKLSRSTVVEWHAALSPRISANRALAHLSKACAFALHRGWIDHNPCIGVERNPEMRRDRYFTDDELRRIGIVARDYPQQIYDCLCLLALTGLRSSEVLQLVSDDFDLSRNVVRLHDTKTGTRTVALSPCAALLCKNIDVNVKHRIAATKAAFSKTIIRVIEKAGVDGASAHTFRHTLATYMAQHGCSVFQIAAMGGWKTLAMVQRYVSLHGIGQPHPIPADERIAALLGLNLLDR